MLLEFLFVAQLLFFEPVAPCHKNENIVDFMSSKYSEDPYWGGRDSDKTKITLFIDPETNSWSIVRSRVDTGLSCLVLIGDLSNQIKPIKGTNINAERYGKTPEPLETFIKATDNGRGKSSGYSGQDADRRQN